MDVLNAFTAAITDNWKEVVRGVAIGLIVLVPNLIFVSVLTPNPIKQRMRHLNKIDRLKARLELTERQKIHVVTRVAVELWVFLTGFTFITGIYLAATVLAYLKNTLVSNAQGYAIGFVWNLFLIGLTSAIRLYPYVFPNLRAKRLRAKIEQLERATPS